MTKHLIQTFDVDLRKTSVAGLSHRLGRLCVATIVLTFLCWLPVTMTAQKPMKAVDKDLPLSAEQTAEAIDLAPLFARIKQLDVGRNPADADTLMLLQQQILLRVTSASLQVAAATGQIDAEIADTRELERYLAGRRDSKIDLLNLASLGIGGTAGTANSILGFTDHDVATSVTSLVAGTAALGFSIWALKVRGGQTRALLAPSNMLSAVFDRPSDPNDVYPLVVIKFMDAVPPDDPEGLSRKERLIRSWVRVGRIPEPSSSKGHEKILRLTSQPRDRIKQSIEDLDDRQAMLYDLRVRLSHIQQDLATLLESVPPVINVSGSELPDR